MRRRGIRSTSSSRRHPRSEPSALLSAASGPALPHGSGREKTVPVFAAAGVAHLPLRRNVLSERARAAGALHPLEHVLR